MLGGLLRRFVIAEHHLNQLGQDPFQARGKNVRNALMVTVGADPVEFRSFKRGKGDERLFSFFFSFYAVSVVYSLHDDGSLMRRNTEEG